MGNNGLVIETGCCGDNWPILTAIDRNPSSLDLVHAGLSCWTGGQCRYKENSFKTGKFLKEALNPA